jgi:hypothetical protein
LQVLGKPQMNLVNLASISNPLQKDCERTCFQVSKSLPDAKLMPKLFLIAGLAALGMALGLWLCTKPIGNPDSRNWFNVFYVLFARNEPAGLSLVIAFMGAVVLWLRRGAPAISLPKLARPTSVSSLIALATFAVCSIGTFAVCHNYALTADENIPNFQTQLFLQGRLTQEIPPFWEPMVRLIMPTHASYLPTVHSWSSGYLPVYTAIRTVFAAGHLQWMTNAVLAAISIVAIAGLTKKLWPDKPEKAVVAVILLAASPQFLITGMTGYAMSAHLALNLIWLWLYCQPDKPQFWLTPLLGVAALGLHQPFFHALFAAPFLLRLVLDRRWKAVSWFGVVYLAGAIFWFFWWRHFLPGFLAGGKHNAFGIHGMTLIIQTIYLCLLLGWLALPIPLLVLLGFCHIRKESAFLRDAALSCALTFGFYVFVKLDQAHGWGDRYFHGAIGCLILVAIGGWDSLCSKIGRPAAATFVAIGAAASLFVQFPMRCVQVENFVRPFANAAEVFHKADADLLVFDPRLAWYSADLRRNDPFLKQRPIILTSFTITDKEIAILAKEFPRTRFVTEEELKALGMETQRYH